MKRTMAQIAHLRQAIHSLESADRNLEAALPNSEFLQELHNRIEDLCYEVELTITKSEMTDAQ